MTKKQALVFLTSILLIGYAFALLNNAIAEEKQKSSSKQTKSITVDIGCIHAGKIIVNGTEYTNSIALP